jgi:hypothetical protein
VIVQAKKGQPEQAALFCLYYHEDEQFNLSAALWTLELDSELLFVGDAGNTEADRPSRRSGI